MKAFNTDTIIVAYNAVTKRGGQTLTVPVICLALLCTAHITGSTPPASVNRAYADRSLGPETQTMPELPEALRTADVFRQVDSNFATLGYYIDVKDAAGVSTAQGLLNSHKTPMSINYYFNNDAQPPGLDHGIVVAYTERKKTERDGTIVYTAEESRKYTVDGDGRVLDWKETPPSTGSDELHKATFQELIGQGYRRFGDLTFDEKNLESTGTLYVKDAAGTEVPAGKVKLTYLKRERLCLNITGYELRQIDAATKKEKVEATSFIYVNGALMPTSITGRTACEINFGKKEVKPLKMTFTYDTSGPATVTTHVQFEVGGKLKLTADYDMNGVRHRVTEPPVINKPRTMQLETKYIFQKDTGALDRILKSYRRIEISRDANKIEVVTSRELLLVYAYRTLKAIEAKKPFGSIYYVDPETVPSVLAGKQIIGFGKPHYAEWEGFKLDFWSDKTTFVVIHDPEGKFIRRYCMQEFAVADHHIAVAAFAAYTDREHISDAAGLIHNYKYMLRSDTDDVIAIIAEKVKPDGSSNPLRTWDIDAHFDRPYLSALLANVRLIQSYSEEADYLSLLDFKENPSGNDDGTAPSVALRASGLLP
ncbi:MAG: hypothetical protein WC712_08690 [Candidatus Brocadiia bacterium]